MPGQRPRRRLTRHRWPCSNPALSLRSYCATHNYGIDARVFYVAGSRVGHHARRIKDLAGLKMVSGLPTAPDVI
jgi:hypothetical protein